MLAFIDKTISRKNRGERERWRSSFVLVNLDTEGTSKESVGPFCCEDQWETQ